VVSVTIEAAPTACGARVELHGAAREAAGETRDGEDRRPGEVEPPASDAVGAPPERHDEPGADQ